MSGRTVEATAPTFAGEGDLGPTKGSSVDVLYLVLEGQRPLAAGARMSLRDLDEIRIGRGPSFAAQHHGATLSVTLPDDRVSTRHARLVRAGHDWTLVDEGSRNGTFVLHDRHTEGPLPRDTPFSVGSCLFLLSRATMASDEPCTLGARLAGRAQGLASLVPSVAEGLGRLARIAASNLPVLLLGESGTGKEVLARATHSLSARADGPFVAVNSGALTASLLEAQLFGHTKGAFSGAVRDEPGYFREASGGTLFLDEIGDLPEGSQAVLLRALETSEVVPVGATRPVRVDVRVVAATLRPVESLREDLRMRLSGYSHTLVPLRDRLADLGLIVAELLPRAAPTSAARIRLSPEAVRAMGAHAWRLNVRELLQALSSAVVLAGDASIVRASDLPAGLGTMTKAVTGVAHIPQSPHAPQSPPVASRPDGAAKPAVPADERKRALLALLAETRGNLSEVARRMSTTRVQVHRWIEKFAIDVDDFRKGEPPQ